MALPGFIDRYCKLQPVCRHIDLFPPQRPLAGLDHRIAFACGRCGDVQLNGIAWLIGGFVELERHAIRASRTGSVAVVLPAITGPKTHATDHIVWRFDFQTV
ncbi:hypothetical protein D3C86_1635390 [compost metagenome]